MSAVAVVRDIERPAILFGPPDERDITAGSTLEQLVAGAWSDLGRGAAVDCLMCGGSVQPRWGAGASPVAGRCEDCGTELS